MAVHHRNDELESLWSSLPTDLALRVLRQLPSPLLFQCRILSKAAHACALRTLARRPFFVYQKPSSECFLLPLDTPSTPLPCSFKLGISSFTLFSTSANLICLQRRYRSMLDVCICSIFCKWKVTLPPIVHPDYAPRLLRRVFTEDSNVDSLSLVIFEAPQDDGRESSHGHGDEGHMNVYGSYGETDGSAVHAPGVQLPCGVCGNVHMFYIVAANNSYSRVFDSRRQEWSDPLYQLADIRSRVPSEQNVAGFPVRVNFDDGEFKLRMSFPSVKDVDSSLSEKCLVLEGVFENDRDALFHASRFNFQMSKFHWHSYTRLCMFTNMYNHQSKLYILLVEKERITCSNRDRPLPQRFTAYHTVQPEDVKRYLMHRDSSDFDFACHEIFPASTPCTLMLYIVHVDTIKWTMQLEKANATALLKLSDMWEIPDQGNTFDMGKFLLIKGIAPCCTANFSFIDLQLKVGDAEI